MNLLVALLESLLESLLDLLERILLGVVDAYEPNSLDV
jgi:hypothetical protein